MKEELTTNHFRVADFYIKLCFAQPEVNNMGLLPSFENFATAPCDEKPFFTLTVDDTLRPQKERKLIRNFDTGNGNTLVYVLPDGGYMYIIRDIRNRDCSLLITNKDFSDCRCALNGDWFMRSFGLNDALMLIFAFAGSFQGTALIHASCIKYGDYAYPFTAKSGTGKSTHTSLWMKHIEGCELLNDDNPAIRVKDGIPYIYGTPWSGKTPCYRNVRARLGAVVRVERAPKNSLEKLKPIPAFATLLPACSSMKWDVDIYNNLCNAVTRIIETTPVYTLYCLPDEEAARLSFATLVGKKED